MQQAIEDFLQILRRAGVPVSPAEHMDALRAVAETGLEDRVSFKAALAASLAKTQADRKTFDRCFERFFDGGTFPGTHAMATPRKPVDVEHLSPLAQALVAGDQARLTVMILEAAQAANLQAARSLLQRGLFVQAVLQRMAADRIDQDVNLLRSLGGSAASVQRLQEGREALFETVRSFVEGRLRLQTDRTPRSAESDDALKQLRLTQAEAADFDTMQRLVRQMVRRLESRHGRRRKEARIGKLDFKRSLRESLATQGLIFAPRWKRRRPGRPDIVALCDVSRSVRNVTRFFLFFLYSLHRMASKIRTFAFCSNLVDVSHVFQRGSLEKALARIESGQGLPLVMGLTDYRKAFEDFAAEHLSRVSRRSVLMVLGDARNNHDAPAEAAFRRIRERVRRIIWLNPEPPAFWNTGDSVMDAYRPHCDRVIQCSTLQHLEELGPYLLADPKRR